MANKPAEKYPLNKVNYSVRAAQAVLQYGVGAMVDFKDQTLMTAAPEYWAYDTVTIHDERLEKLLKVSKFGMPTGEDGHRIAYARFPEWYFCPKCRRMKPLKQWTEEYKRKARKEYLDRDPYMVNRMRCPSCNQSLVVARIVTACEHGHINDFPWVEWTHCRNMGGAKRICSHPDILFKTGSSATEGLEGLVVTCETCKARATLKGAFEPGILKALHEKSGGQFDFVCKGRHPWKNKKEICSEFPRVLQRGSSSVYFPVTASSLVIPPYSDRLTERIDGSEAYSEFQAVLTGFRSTQGVSEELLATLIATQISIYANKIALEISESEEIVKHILERKLSVPDEAESTMSVSYRAEEYDALTGKTAISPESDRSFVREATDIRDYQNMPFVKSVSLINKIREVQALVGFTRIKPSDPTESTEKQVNVVSVKEPGTDWYPAYQVMGEGIFLEFDNSAIRCWINDNIELEKRIGIINENYRNSFIGQNRPRNVTARFVLLHTLSHLLIKQLSFECGYSIASVKERIYCGEEDDEKEMAGIFIYTASGDSEGTMGGLVRQGRPDTFPKIFNKALKAAMVCSNDPVCNLSLGQGRDSLNLSACYSCALIPETSCEEYNVFLDRGCIIGTYNHPEVGFYSRYLESEDFVNEPQNDNPETDKSDPTPRVNAFRLIPDTSRAINLSDTPYASIFEDMRSWSNDETEKALFDTLITVARKFELKEKPYRNVDVYIGGEPEPLYCELYWEKSDVFFFLSEDNDSYEKAMRSGQKCFCGSDPGLTAEKLIASLKER